MAADLTADDFADPPQTVDGPAENFTGNLLLDNGSGVDSDIDGGPKTVTHVNGVALATRKHDNPI